MRHTDRRPLFLLNTHDTDSQCVCVLKLLRMNLCPMIDSNESVCQSNKKREIITSTSEKPELCPDKNYLFSSFIFFNVCFEWRGCVVHWHKFLNSSHTFLVHSTCSQTLLSFNNDYDCAQLFSPRYLQIWSRFVIISSITGLGAYARDPHLLFQVQA